MPDQAEIEIKFHVPDPGAVRDALRAAGLHARPVHEERNLRFDWPDGGLTAAGTVLRIRTRSDGEPGSAVVTIKTPLHTSHGLHTRREIEYHVDDGEAARAGFEALGYAVTWRYEKRREVWQGDRIEADLDDTPLGWFVELEGDPDRIHAVAGALGFSVAEDGIPYSYAELTSRACAALGVPLRDLTFAAWSDAPISESLIRQIVASDGML